MILCAGFVVNAMPHLCLLQHLVLSDSEWLEGLLDMLAHFSKISLLWEFRLCLSVAVRKPYFIHFSSIRNLLKSLVRSFIYNFFPPSDSIALFSFVLKLL